MAGIFGRLGLSDTERVFAATQGQSVIFEEAQTYIDRVNAEMAQVLSVFVEETTADHKRRYKLPGGGTLARRGADGTYGAVKAYGYWDVAFPLEDFGAEVAGNDVAMAYMTVRELENHINTVVAKNVNTVRWQMLHHLLDNVQGTFVDPLWGSLSIEPLANGDTVVYPPVLGSETEATEDHYLESGYASASISDANDPIVTIVDDVEHHFGAGTGGENIAVFINNAQRSAIEGLTDFDPVPDRFIRPGDNVSVPFGWEMLARVGRVIGRHSAGAWVVEWRFMPANYLLGINLEAPKPLIMRVDPEDTGLGRGLQLVARDSEFPFVNSTWRHRFGFGAGNRLNGVVMELGTGGSYSVPAAYT
jgi:hypothetical protein